MALEKCPRCELNYILDGGKLCTVCRKEVRGEDERDEIAELCSECGENPVVSGGELCLNCLKEMARRLTPVAGEEEMGRGDRALEIDSVSGMDEMVIDIGDEIPVDAFEGEEIDEELEEEIKEDKDFMDDDPEETED